MTPFFKLLSLLAFSFALALLSGCQTMPASGGASVSYAPDGSIVISGQWSTPAPTTKAGPPRLVVSTNTAGQLVIRPR